MPEGQLVIPRPRPEVLDRLGPILAGANCEVLSRSEHRIVFRHGTYLTQSAPLMPKRCTLDLHDADGRTAVHYAIAVTGFARVWLVFIGIVFCWAIFPPILAYRALVHHPRQFVRNLLAGI